MQHIQDFVAEIEKTGYLQVVDENHSGAPADDHLIVLNTKDNQKYKVLIDSIYKYDWSNLKRVLDGGETQVLDHLTRIVGYFSKTSNWNKSKLGELEDRRRGNYRITES